MKRSNALLLHRLRQIPIEQIAISTVTEAELLFGARLASKPAAVLEALDAFVRHVKVLEFTRDAAEHYADIRCYLHKRGQMIGSNDLMIAAHCRSMDATLVTNNEREFKRVKGLKVDNWCRG